MRGKQINNRELLARRINEPAGLKDCQLVFVSENEEKRLPEILNRLNGAEACWWWERPGILRSAVAACNFFWKITECDLR